MGKLNAVAARTAAGIMGGFLAIFLARIGGGAAFPTIDPTNVDSVPGAAPLGTALPETDVRGLRDQLRLISPGTAGNPSAWTIVPRLTVEQMFTDNALEVTSPRRADAITVISPGISILADTARIRLNLDYQPSLFLHAINGPLNVVTQQLTATGIVTIVPDLAYVDVRALSGVQSRLGALAGTGSLGAGAGDANATGQGLNRNNEVQTASYGLSPYLLRQFGDYGSGKLGASIDASRFSTINGFISSPFPTGGSNAQSLLTTEQFAHYQTGEFLRRLQYGLDIDVSQSRSESNGIAVTLAGTTTTVPSTSFHSERETINNQFSYALNRTVTLLASVGQQRITYSVPGAPNISGLIWSVGFTLTPSPDSAVTVTYGRQNGANAFQANGHVAVGGRSLLSFDYSNTVGTQLENLQNQLNNSAVGPNGALINARTGGTVLGATNAPGVQNGVFRFNTFNASFSTRGLRDTVQTTLTWSEQTSLTPALTQASITFDPVTGQAILTPVTTAGPTTQLTTAAAYWMHELSPDLILNSSISYSYIRRSGGINDNSLSTGVSLQYTLSPSTTLIGRYSFFGRTSKISGYGLYENILLLGVTRQF